MSAKQVKSNTQEKKSSKKTEETSFPLIETKFQIPYRRSDLLLRTRLVNNIHSYLDRKLIVVTAPAGYGKTALLTDFANDSDLPVCWYTIDQFDRDLQGFLEYLIAAIAQRFPEFGVRSRAILSQTTDPGKNLVQVVATLVQEIHDKIPEYFVIILDDHHTIEDRDQINEFLDLFITYVDENCHLIISSRSLPALPNFSLLVARRQAAGMGLDDLRFTAAEIQALAEQNFGETLSLNQAENLVQQTGGWITGLQLTDISQWKQPPIDRTGGQINYHIYEFLTKQVMDQQPKNLKNFLLESSVLDEISPDICENVLGVKQPFDLIDQLRIRNLFIIEFEGDIDRLRYNDLFREFLSTSFKRQNEPKYRDLTLRAADYYAAQGEWDRAISRYQILGEYQNILDIVVQIGSVMFDSGRWNTLAGWIDALPESSLENNPQLLLHRAKIHAERGEHSAALDMFDRAERAFTALEDKAMAARALAMKGHVLRYQGHYAEAIAQCQQAFALITGDTQEGKFSNALAHKNIGLCLIRLGQMPEGRQALHRALRLYEELAIPQDIGMVHHDLGLSLELTGDLEGAIFHYKAALDNWEQLGNLSPWANTLNGLGVVYHQQGQYELAEKHLTEALAKTQQSMDMRIEAYTLASIGDLKRDLGAYDEALSAYAQALEIAQRTHVGFIVTCALNGMGNVAQLTGEIQQARKRLQQALENAEDHGSSYEIGVSHTSLGVLANEERDLVTAQKHLDKAIEILETSGLKQQLGQASLHRAQSSFLNDDYDKALGFLERTLAIADQLCNDQFVVVGGVQAQGIINYAIKKDFRKETLSHIQKRIETHLTRIDSKQKTRVGIESQPKLKIYALGQPNVEVDEKSVQWAVARSRDLFFYLLQNPNGKSKEQIGAIFWPDHEPERLDSAFRSTLYRLRRTVFRDSVVFEDGLYFFNWSSDYWFDVKSFNLLLDNAEDQAYSHQITSLYEGALDLYRSDYLQGTYHDWAVIERERLRGRYLQAIETLAGIYAEKRKLPHAIELYQNLITEDPFQEVAYRELMRCHYRQGDRAAAIRQYQICADMLRNELDLAPSKDTEDLYLRIIS
jgi:ATP/maltotriose-dependent transcriptional regulator MalT